ncbi:MAG: glycosyl transferase family 4 [Pseudoxanthomonas sp.]|nr:glycosyl transferase family 4 [Pseudoxanthomonas sp.]
MIPAALPTWMPPLLALLLAAAVSALIAGLQARHRLGPLDLPGPRSSHQRPVPRTGGLGIVVIGLAGIAALALARAWPTPWLLTLPALALVALVGLLDDARPRPALPRLLAHLLAALLLSGSLLVGAEGLRAAPWLALASVLAIAWSINLHNFMDGIDGLLAMQAIWYGGAYAIALGLAGEYGAALFAALVAAAAAGFLPFNFPRARVFLGDGASGFIGAAAAWLLLFAAVHAILPLPLSLVLMSAFLVDSGATLAYRLLRGERVWQAHRSHLYQLLVQAGASHARVSLGYLAWNLLVALPALLLGLTMAPERQWLLAVAVLAAAAGLWLLLRIALSRRLASKVADGPVA